MTENGENQTQKKKNKSKYFDYNLLFIVIFLVCFGLVMLYSSSSYTAANKYGDSAYYLKRQIRNMLIGGVFMTYFSLKDYHRWKKVGGLLYFLAIILCLLVLIPGVGTSSHGSARWLSLGPLSFQPSEFAKLAAILFLAMFLEKLSEGIGTMKGLAVTGAFLLPLFVLVSSQNLSTGVIFFAIAVCMIWVASPRYLHFIVIGAVGLLFVVIFIFSSGYRGDRIEAFLNPENAQNGYQTMQGLYAIGSGRLFGKGLGESIQKMGNVPESQNDMIFSIVCEELGLFGAVCVILLFLLLLWRMMVIANNATDMYGALLVSGILGHIALQVVLNIAVVTNTIPNTGVTLPFFSYGGTSIVFLMTEMGLALSVSKGIRLNALD